VLNCPNFRLVVLNSLVLLCGALLYCICHFGLSSVSCKKVQNVTPLLHRYMCALAYLSFQIAQEPNYYLLIIYLKKLCIHVRKSHLEIKKIKTNLKNRIKKFALYFIFWHCISKILHCLELRNFSCILLTQ
jgi:hypothetical protein